LTDLQTAQNPKCPSGIMQWQHGSYTYNTDGSLTLNPIAVDGRQLLSTPCDYDNSIYTRYNQTETMKVSGLGIWYTCANKRLTILR